MTLCFVFVEDLEGNAKVIQDAKTVELLNKKLEDAMTRENHRDGSFSVEEGLYCFFRLAQNRENSLKMTSLGILDSCATVLSQKYSMAEVKWALKLVLNLTFNHEIVGQINFKEKIAKFTSCEDSEISDTAARILFEVEKYRKSFSGSAEEHVMISYCWAQQAMALKLSDKLKEEGLKVWLDVDKMTGDMLEKMSSAVERASSVICCVSEDYLASQNCRQEAKYANQLRKHMVFVKLQHSYRPTGWLALLMSAQIYYEMESDAKIGQNVEKLLKVLREESNLSAQNATEGTTTDTKTKLSDVENYTSEQVLDWMRSTNLFHETQLENFHDFDGRMLNELKCWQRENSELFNQFCRENLKQFNPLQLLKFCSLLKRLN